MPAKRIDRTNKRYGILTALYPTDKKDNDGTIIWHCRCDCGNEIDVGKGINQRESCGCLGRERNKQRLQKLGESRRKDLTNQVFGRLTALYPTDKKHEKRRSIIWHCKCSCGKEVDILSERLLEGRTQSCGCLKAEKARERNIKDLTNQRFGKLVVLEQSDKKSKYGIVWKCLCDCGNVVDVLRSHLLRGNTRSCGCIKSYGEQQILAFLQQNNILYKREVSFDDLRTSRNGKCRFDFGIYNKQEQLICLIEYQGIQHFIDTGIFGKMQREETDQLKEDYCNNHNIPLYKINYNEDNIEQQLKIILQI